MNSDLKSVRFKWNLFVTEVLVAKICLDAHLIFERD